MRVDTNYPAHLGDWIQAWPLTITAQCIYCMPWVFYNKAIETSLIKTSQIQLSAISL